MDKLWVPVSLKRVRQNAHDGVFLGIGVFQAYYQTHQLSEYSPSDVSWIPSLEVFMMFAGVCRTKDCSLLALAAVKQAVLTTM